MAGQHGVPVHVGAHGASGHHARKVVSGEDHRPLVGAGRQDHPASPDVPQPLPGDARDRVRAEVVGAVLGDEQVVVVVVAGRRRPGEDPRVGLCGQLRADGRHPVECGSAVDLFPAGEQGPAEFRLVVDQDDPGTGASGREGGSQAGRATADDQDVGVDVHLVVDGFVGGRVEPAEAAQAGRREALVQLDRRRQPHRLRTGTVDLDEGVGLLNSRCGDAAWPPAVEAGGGVQHAAREQGGGERVALQAGVPHAVEGEAQGSGAVDPSAVREAVRGGRRVGRRIGHGITGFG